MTAGLITLATVGVAPEAHAAGSDIYLDCSAGSDTNNGSSSQPFLTLSKAVSEANGDAGSTIHLAPGTCTVPATNTITEDTTVIGSGSGTVLELDSSVTAFEVAPNAGDPEASLTVKDLAIDGQGKADTQGVDFNSWTTNTEHLTVDGVTMTDTSGTYPVYAALWNNSTAIIDVEHNTVKNTHGGIVVHSDSNSSGTVTITDNEVTGTTGGSGDGIYVDANGATGFTINGNTVQNNADHGINIHGFNGTATVSATGNTASDNGSIGINIHEMHAGNTLALSTNTTDNNGLIGINAGDPGQLFEGTSNLTDNIARGNDGDGFAIVPTGPAVVHISGNTSDHNDGRGTYVYGRDSAQVTVDGDTTSHNTVGMNLDVVDSAEVSINNARITDNTSAGIYAASFGTTSAVDISNAEVVHNGGGINLYPADGAISITDSTIRDSTAAALASGTGVAMRPVGNDQDGLEVGTVLIDSTLITGNNGSGIDENVDGPVELTVSNTTVDGNGTANGEGGSDTDGLTIHNQLIPEGESAAQVHIVNSTVSNHPNGSQINVDRAWATDVDIAFSTLTDDGNPGAAALRIARPEGNPPGGLPLASVAVTHSILDNGADDPAIRSIGLGDGSSGALGIDYTLASNVTAGSAAEAVLNAGDDNILNEDPQLGPLADNGGVTDTFLPAASSPVVDAGLEKADYNSAFGGTFGSAPSQDQRLQPRFGSPADLGAVELSSEAETPPPSSPPSSPQQTVLPAPRVTQAACSAQLEVTAPAIALSTVKGVTYAYKVNGDSVDDLSDVEPGDTVKIRATAADDLELTGGDGWKAATGSAYTYTLNLDDAGCQLANTGANTAGVLGVGLMMLLAGSGLMITRRLRHRS